MIKKNVDEVAEKKNKIKDKGMDIITNWIKLEDWYGSKF